MSLLREQARLHLHPLCSNWRQSGPNSGAGEKPRRHATYFHRLLAQLKPPRSAIEKR
jgi:hypothetical protein